MSQVQELVVKMRAPRSSEGDFVLITDRSGALRVTVPYSDKLRAQMGARTEKYHSAKIVDGKLELGREVDVPTQDRW
jgi:hypothetical protein